MKVFFMTLLGLVVFPIFWVLQKLGVVAPPPTLSPTFAALNAHLFHHGLSAVFEVQAVPPNHTLEVALLRLGFAPTRFHVVTVTVSEDEDRARLVEAEAAGAPQFTGVRRNGKLVMACTFSPPNERLEQAFGDTFMAFPGGS